MGKQKQMVGKVMLSIILCSLFFHSFADTQAKDIFNTISSGEKKQESIKYSGIIVKYKKQKVNLSNYIGYLGAKKVADNNDLEIIQNNKKLNVSLLETTQDNVDLTQVMEDIKKDVSVESVQPNYTYDILSYDEKNDTNKAVLWALDNQGQDIQGQTGFSGSDISWDESMDLYSQSLTVSPVVAVLDTGVAYNHPDLINSMWDGSNCVDHEGNFLGGCVHGYDYDQNDKDPMIVNMDHGTHVAGIIAATMNNAKGVIGVNPNAKIMAVKMENMTTMDIVNAINFAKYNHANVINASFGGYDWIDPLLYEAIKSFGDAGGLFIAAAGNGGSNHDLGGINRIFPAGYGVDNQFGGNTLTGLTNIISVAATDNQDHLASFSDYGNNTVHIGAPGVSIYSTVQSQTKDVAFAETFTGTYLTGNIYSFQTGGINNHFGANFGFHGIWGDTNAPFATGSTGSYIEQTFDTSTLWIPTLSFNMWCDAGKSDGSIYTDYMNVSFSTGGAFQDIGKIDYWHPYLTTMYDIDGKIGYYGTLTYDIEKYKSNNFTVRFTWNSDDTASSDLGCLLFGNDNYPFEITGMDDGSHEAYGYKDGTSMATPYVAGLASLAFGYRTDLSNIEIKNAILENGDDIASLSGKTITGKRINAYKTLFAIQPPDPVPDSFSFTGLTNQTLNTVVESNPIMVTGMNTGATVTIVGGEYKIGTGTYTSATGMVYSGDTLTVRHTTSGLYNTTTTTTLNIEGISSSFTAITGDAPPDMTPNAFSFQTLTGQLLDTPVVSNVVTITGINTGTLVTVVGGEYKIGTGSYTSASGIIFSGNTLQLRHTTSHINATNQTTTVTVGTLSGSFISSTYDQAEIVTPVSSTTGSTLTGTTTVGSGFALIGEENVGQVYVFSGSDLSHFITGSILDTSGTPVAVVTIGTSTQMYTQSGSFTFEKKLLPTEEQTLGTVKQVFTGAITLGTTQSILLDTPAIIQYFTDNSATKVAYRKSGTSTWTIINIESNTCTPILATKPVCAYKVGNEIFISTYHFTDFALVKEETITTKKTSSGGGGGGSSKDYCPNGDTSSSYYDRICGIKTDEKTATATGKYNDIKDNNAQFFSNRVPKKEMYKGYEIIKIEGYPLSASIHKIVKYIIDNAKFTSLEKQTYVKTFHNFLEAKYYYANAKQKTQKLKNAYTKQVILLKNTIKKLSK